MAITLGGPAYGGFRERKINKARSYKAGETSPFREDQLVGQNAANPKRPEYYYPDIALSDIATNALLTELNRDPTKTREIAVEALKRGAGSNSLLARDLGILGNRSLSGLELTRQAEKSKLTSLLGDLYKLSYAIGDTQLQALTQRQLQEELRRQKKRRNVAGFVGGLGNIVGFVRGAYGSSSSE